MTKALIIRSDGSMPTVHDIPHGETYSAIKDVIASPRGSWFDCAHGTSFHGYVNDTGIIDGLNVNTLASVLFGQIICGDVILFGSVSPQGEHRTTFALNDDYVDHEYDIPDFVTDSVRTNWNLWKESLDARDVVPQVEDGEGSPRIGCDEKWCALWGSNPGPAD